MTAAARRTSTPRLEPARDITLGLAFTRGDVDVDDVLRLRRPALEVDCG